MIQVQNTRNPILVSNIKINDIVTLRIGQKTPNVETQIVYCQVIGLCAKKNGEQYGVNVIHLKKEKEDFDRVYFTKDKSQPLKDNNPQVTKDPRKITYTRRNFYKIG